MSPMKKPKQLKSKMETQTDKCVTAKERENVPKEDLLMMTALAGAVPVGQAITTEDVIPIAIPMNELVDEVTQSMEVSHPYEIASKP
ncbi:hypothetical protein AB6A40_006458 [Gnathostoma spinigerum]|uniref:Uncharacterized protein n=1 Tax=Gnathostoma spinigerum TaxID=75299 RepID=A0ABD6ENM0_9BILA